MAPSAYTGPVVYNDKDKFKKVDFGEIDKEAADPARKPAFTKSADNGWVGMVEHYFVAAWLPPQDKPLPRQFYTDKLDNGLYTAGVRHAAGTIAPGATGEISARAVCRPAGPGRARPSSRHGPRPRRRLRHLHHHRGAAVLLLKWLHGLDRQLGLVDHRA